MCRLFALHAGAHDVPAEFWLLSAPDSFAAQGEHNADGFGIATLSTRDGQLLVRNPIKAASDRTYRQVSQRARASQFLAHLRYASTGEVSLANTHPFLMDNRAFAPHGVVGDPTRCGCCTANRTVTRWCKTTPQAPWTRRRSAGDHQIFRHDQAVQGIKSPIRFV